MRPHFRDPAGRGLIPEGSWEPVWVLRPLSAKVVLRRGSGQSMLFNKICMTTLEKNIIQNLWSTMQNSNAYCNTVFGFERTRKTIYLRIYSFEPMYNDESHIFISLKQNLFRYYLTLNQKDRKQNKTISIQNDKI